MEHQKLSWLWLLPDLPTDLRDFPGGLYCILKLVEGIRKENLKIENTSTDSSPAMLDRQSLGDKDHFELIYGDSETSHVS